MPVSPSRRVAFDILLRVERDAAFSTELLHAASGNGAGEAGAGKLDSRDHGLATEIALGCLRRRGEIDFQIEKAAGRPVTRLDPEVRAALRIGCYQLLYLDRIPARAAVSESVELVKMARKRSATGFVNAVLRKLPPREASSESAGRSDPEAPLRWSYPDWLVARWEESYGPEVTAGILRAGLETPPTYLRLNPQFDQGETLRRLADEGVATEETELPAARRVLRGRAHETRCFAEGRFRMQDISSQCVVPLLELGPGHSFLDLCAAPGGKTFQAIETRGSSRGVVAADRHLHRLRTLRELAPTGLTDSPAAAKPSQKAGSEVNCVVLDGQQPLPFRGVFDRILVDAPCSGTGTLARNPEIKWRLEADDIRDLAVKQTAILNNALEALAPGGLLVYSTCSLEQEENQGVANFTLKGKTTFRAGAYFQRVPGREPGDGFFAIQIWRQG